MNLWLLMIYMHTVAATLCFVAGLFVISPARAGRHPWLVSGFLSLLFLMEFFMAGATMSHWESIGMSQKITFSALGCLGVYMCFRGWEARQLFARNLLNAAYMDHVGFVLIGLFDGFAILTLLDLKFPLWLVFAGGVAAIFAGRYFVRTAKQKML